ncbi:Dyp-type peroxidase [Pedobacter caeni]|uniref:Putative iron-dependent peroxidase n=1 Tax=Pedobacter caeni TaxID=288992 RepID=A0A1M5GKK6_9SPHI|nr:Dyp-type peroxidase [Pedobacter caeni]SHG04233.1 putative iron-dependent peroxidase [Pedobacter caeni]
MKKAIVQESQNVTDYPNNNTIFAVWKFKHAIEIKPAFEKLCSLVANLNHSYAVRIPDGRVSCVMGIGHDAWVQLSLPTPLPKELKNFEAICGSKHTAIATPGDLHFHLRGTDMSVCFDMISAIAEVLQPVADCLEEVHGFRYWDGRSILGFVDGTENPTGEQRQFFATVGDEDPDHKGGSYLFVQKYLHNMGNWAKLPVEEQEKVIGRYKSSDIEMPDEVKPDNSHSALANIEDEEGNELKIVRDNMPFGNPAKNEVGTYFIAYANTFSTTHKMLERMFIGAPAGNYDRILDFSTAHTGSLFFAPSVNILKEYTADTDS